MNRGSDSVTGVYSDARAEYTKQLSIFLVPAYFQFFFHLLEKAKAATTAEPKKFLWQFQTYLNEIPDWNMEKVSTEISTLQGNCGCDYLEDLLTAVFIAHTKVLTAIRVNSKQKKVQITVPKVEHFLFKVLCECSKLLWGSTYLFRDGISSIEKQQNYRNVEGLLNEGIGQAIRALVPVKSLLRDFVAMDDGEDEDEKEETEVMAQPTTTSSAAAATPAPLGSEIPVSTPVMTETAVTVPLAEESVAPVTEETAVEQSSTRSMACLPLTADTAAPVAEVIGGSDVPPRIVVDTSVHFTDFDTVFDDNPDKSSLVYEPKDRHSSEAPPTGDILEGEAMPIGDDDLDSLGGGEESDNEDETATIGEEATDLGEGEYDVLV